MTTRYERSGTTGSNRRGRARTTDSATTSSTADWWESRSRTITIGPAWVMRSVFANCWGTSFKWGIDSDGVVFIYHNTSWVNEADENAMGIGSAVHNSVMRNNIFHGTRYAFEVCFEGNTGHDWDYDNWHTTRGSDEPHFKWEDVRYDTMAELCTATGLECNGHEDDPGLTDPSNGEFTLAPGSPNIDRGVSIPGINDDSVGAPDIGCCEASSGD